MNALRKPFQAVRRKRSSVGSSVDSGKEEASPGRRGIDTIKMGLQDPMMAVAPRSIKSDATSIVSVVDSIDSSRSDSTVSVYEETTAATTVTVVRKESSGKLVGFTRIHDIVGMIRGMISKLDDYDETCMQDEDLNTYLQYIADQRLMYMPPKGSPWDRVLRTAQFFGLQLWDLGDMVDDFAPSAREAAIAALVSCRILLEIGERRAEALLPTFMALYELGLLMSQLKQMPLVFSSSPAIKEDLGNLYGDLVSLVGTISTRYRQRMNGMGSSTVNIRFDAEFGKDFEDIWERKTALLDRIWMSKLGSKRYPISLSGLRDRLNPTQSSFRGALFAELAEDLERAEDTCEWIKYDLAEFFERDEEKVLTVTGPPGCGKSVLADWVEERLQRPLDRKVYTVLSYFFPFESAEDATPLSFLKSLLSQILERSVGHVELYESLVHAFKVEERERNVHALEDSLWKALRSGLIQFYQESKQPIAILIDGFDVLSGNHPAIEFHKALRECLSGLYGIHAITFSRHISHISEGCRHITITPHINRDDISSFFRETLTKSQWYDKLSTGARGTMIEKLVEKSKGSFLWAGLVSRLILRATSYEAFVKTAESVSSGVDHILNTVVGKIDLKNNHLREMIAFMLISKRPMTLENMADLLAINVAKHNRVLLTPTDVAKLASQKCGDIMLVKDGHLHFRTAGVRDYMKALMGKSLPSVEEAHFQLTLKMLLYAKLCLVAPHDPCIEGLNDRAIKELFSSHRTLHYVMTTWVSHFKRSSICGGAKAGGDLAISKEFKDVFPDSTMFSMLEMACRHSYRDIFGHLELTLRIREACFGEKHTSVLQTLIVLGNLHHAFSHSNDAAKYYYRASKLGRVVLSRFSTVVISCTRLLLTITETIVITKRTEIVTYREEMIRFMIEVCKHRDGPSSPEVIVWYEKLATLYITIKEETLAAIVYKELYEIIVHHHGRHCEKARDIAQYFGGLNIVLKDDGPDSHVTKYREVLLETSEDFDFTSETQISILLQLAYSYVLEKKWYIAERLYLSLWRRVCITCRTKARVEIHIAKIQVALAYIKFLRKVERIEEASNILICLWAEYEHHSFESELILVWIREIGVLFKAFGMLSIAISVFTKVWGWLKSKGKCGGEEGQRTTILITEVVEEITETTVSTKTTTTTTTEVTETVVREIYETHFTRCKHSKVDKAFFSACMALIGIYLKQENWGEAEIIIRKSLEISWKAVLSVDVKISLSEHCVSETIILVSRLALCYRRQRQFEHAEKLYLRVYYACLAALSLEDAILIEVRSKLISFYEEHHRHERVLEIYIEILEKYRKHLGATHQLTIKTLYLIAAQYEMLGRKEAYEYYIEIVKILNKGIKHCHHDAFEASLILCRYYHTEKRWSELQKICVALWETFIHHHTTVVFTEEIITLIYEKYTYVLEFHAKVEFSILYKLTVEYRETVVKVFGASAAIVILAMIALAKICEKSEKHHHESVTIYEEVIKKTTTTKTTTTTVTETTITTVKKRLSKMYVTIITSSGSITTTTVERAIAMCIEVYEHLKIELGCWHETTLLKLKDIVILYQKLSTQEYHVKIMQLLQVSVVEIITTLTVTAHLFEAAATLASIYLSCGMAKQGQDLLHQLRHLLVFRDSMPSSEITLRLDVNISRVVFVFVASFEQRLLGKASLSFTEIMASLLLEAILYEEYTRVLETESSATIETVLITGARLRVFWEEERKTNLVAVLDKKLFTLFKNKYGGSFKASQDESSRVFYVALLTAIGVDKPDINFAVLACRAGRDKVKTLIEQGEFKRAVEVARCAFQFASKQHLYRRKDCLPYGYKLAELLAGIDVARPAGCDARVAASMLEASREITIEVLAEMRAAGIDAVSMRWLDIAGLVRLLGRQESYAELESLLHALWKSRHEQRGWSSTTVLSIGKAMVHARYAQGGAHVVDAIELCDVLWYNLRRGRGWLDPETAYVAQLLASLYIGAGRIPEAMAVHEAVLREIEAACGGKKDSQTNGGSKAATANGNNNNLGKEDTQADRTVLTAHACLHLESLRAAHAIKNKWGPKGDKEYRELYHRLKGHLALQLPAFDKWLASANEKQTDLAKYTPPKDWKIDGDQLEIVKAGAPKKRKPETVRHSWWFAH